MLEIKMEPHSKLDLIEMLRANTQKKIMLEGKAYSKAEIYNNIELKGKLVEENPKLAENLYYQWREYGERELGDLFAVKYNGDGQYGASAFHIAQELGIPGIKKPQNAVIDSVEEEELKIFKEITR